MTLSHGNITYLLYALDSRNTGIFSALAVDYWQKLPQDLKDLSISNFPRKVKQYLLSN